MTQKVKNAKQKVRQQSKEQSKKKKTHSAETDRLKQRKTTSVKRKKAIVKSRYSERNRQKSSKRKKASELEAKKQPRPSSKLKKKRQHTKKSIAGKWKKKFNFLRKKLRKRLAFSAVSRGIRDFLLVTLGTAVVCLTISFFFFGIETVQGYSMMPTLKDGDTVFIQKSKNVKRLDIVLFQRGQVQQIRRIIGLPGERIDYKDDLLYVDGNLIDEKFIINEINEAQRNGGQYTEDFQLQDISEVQVIPENCYLVLGDNREYGSDSREYGLITSEQLIGIVKMRLLPLNDLSAF